MFGAGSDPDHPGNAGCFLFVVAVCVLATLFVSAVYLLVPLMFSQNPGAAGGGGGAGASPTPTAPAGVVVYRGPGTLDDIPLISARDFIGGDAPVTTSGAFTLASTLSLGGGTSDGVDASWVYGTYPDGAGISMGFSRREGAEGLGLNIYTGDYDWVATYLGEGCSWEVEVAPSSVSGHISCTDLSAVNEATGATGTIDVELDFSADTVAIPGESGGNDYVETPPGY